MTNPAPIALVNKKIIPKASIYYCFKILLAKKANIYVENTPDSIVTQFTSFDILVYKGATPPNTSDTNVNLDKLFPSEVRRNLSPFRCFPFQDGRGIGVGVEPLFRPFDHVEDRFVLRYAFQKRLAFLLFYPTDGVPAVRVDR